MLAQLISRQWDLLLLFPTLGGSSWCCVLAPGKCQGIAFPALDSSGQTGKYLFCCSRVSPSQHCDHPRYRDFQDVPPNLWYHPLKRSRSHPPPEHCLLRAGGRESLWKMKPGVYPSGFALLLRKMREEIPFTHCSTTAKPPRQNPELSKHLATTAGAFLCDNPWGQQTLLPFDLPLLPLQTPGYTFLPTPETHHLHPSHPHPAVSNHPPPGATDRNKIPNTPGRE